MNETFSFNIVGDLTIPNITQQVTFGVTATLVSETELIGKVGATISQQDCKLTIPSVSQVANAGEAVLLIVDFLTTAHLFEPKSVLIPDHVSD